MGFKLNPFTGLLDLVPSTVQFAKKISEVFNCDSGTQIGDVVRPSEIITDTVVSLTSNVYTNLAFGVVIAKPTATTCEVLISGKLEGFSGLTFGKVLYIDTDGTLTTDVPATGHLQKMGMALKSDTIFLLPSMEKVVRP
jgi:hypothetical protein